MTQNDTKLIKITEADKTADKNILTTRNPNKSELADEEKLRKKKLFKDMSKLSGSDGEYFGEMILNQLAHIGTPTASILSMIENIGAIAPKDHIEGMLTAQMIATHNAAMSCFTQALKHPLLDATNASLTSATKLTRTYTMQMEALNKYRGKGQQKMTVEHVHVNAGGQAIIGNVSSNKENKEE